MRPTSSLVLHICGQQAIDDTTPEILPDIPCKALILKSPAANTGVIYFRRADDGTTLDATNGYGLSPGEESPVLFGVGNANNVILLAGVDDESVNFITYR
jgi:hypothetical protein